MIDVARFCLNGTYPGLDIHGLAFVQRHRYGAYRTEPIRFLP